MKSLVVHCQAGLGNRFRALVSGHRAAAKLGRQLLVIWPLDSYHCNCPLELAGDSGCVCLYAFAGSLLSHCEKLLQYIQPVCGVDGKCSSGGCRATGTLVVKIYPLFDKTKNVECFWKP